MAHLQQDMAPGGSLPCAWPWAMLEVVSGAERMSRDIREQEKRMREERRKAKLLDFMLIVWSKMKVL